MTINFTSDVGSWSNFFLQENRTIWISLFDPASNLLVREKLRLYQIHQSGGVTDFMVDFEIFNPDGASTLKFTSGGQFIGPPEFANYRLLFPHLFNAEQNDQKLDYSCVCSIGYPDEMKIGDSLKDGKCTIEYTLNEVHFKTVFSVESRTVAGKEVIETNYGSIECFKISSRANLSSTAGMDVEGLEVTEWFVPRLGVIKQESAMGRIEITYYGESPGLN